MVEVITVDENDLDASTFEKTAAFSAVMAKSDAHAPLLTAVRRTNRQRGNTKRGPTQGTTRFKAKFSSRVSPLPPSFLLLSWPTL
jgi:hypothetical protein